MLLVYTVNPTTTLWFFRWAHKRSAEWLQLPIIYSCKTHSVLFEITSLTIWNPVTCWILPEKKHNTSFICALIVVCVHKQWLFSVFKVVSVCLCVTGKVWYKSAVKWVIYQHNMMYISLLLIKLLFFDTFQTRRRPLTTFVCWISMQSFLPFCEQITED